MSWFINGVFEPLNMKKADYCCIISRTNKKEVINLIQNIDFTKKPNNIKHKTLLSHNKIDKEVLAFGDIEI